MIDTIYARRSIRKYQERPVEREKLETLLKAAMAAPSARNGKPWEFVVVTEPEGMAKVRSAMVFGGYNAPAAIIVCANTRSEEHTSELQSHHDLVCRLLLEKNKVPVHLRILT